MGASKFSPAWQRTMSIRVISSGASIPRRESRLWTNFWAKVGFGRGRRHFIYHGAQAGEPGILATFHENETQLERIVSSFGWSVDNPDVHLLSRGVVGMNIDEWVYELLELVERTGAKRIVIDSLPDLEIGAGDPVRFREWVFSVTQRFTRAGISLMFIVEIPELFELHRISDQGISHLADNVILLQYVQDGPELVRALTILKTRAMQHRPIVHRYEITEHGFVLGDVLSLAR